MKLARITPQDVEVIPSDLENGVLYISTAYDTAVHLCFCGCRNKVTTPLQVGGWKLTRRGSRVSLYPSIGNGSFPCRSHYWVRDNRVEWTKPMTAVQVARDRTRDQRDAARAADILNGTATPKASLWRRLKGLFGGR